VFGRSLQGEVDQFIENRAPDSGLEAIADQNIRSRRIAQIRLRVGGGADMDRVVRHDSLWSAPAPSAFSSTATKGASSTAIRPRSAGVINQ
jgi:hypothetical protein